MSCCHSLFVGGLGGFVNAQAAGAKAILEAVKRVFSDHGISRVTLVGHSLGAAISTIEGVYLKLALPPSTTFKHVLHGSPRVGNQQFADYIDAHVGTQAHSDARIFSDENRRLPFPVLRLYSHQPR